MKHVRRAIAEGINGFVFACGLASLLGLFLSAGGYAETPEKYLAANRIQSQQLFSTYPHVIQPLRESRYVQVPDLIGKTVDSAQVIIRQKGFELKEITYVDTLSVAGIVIAQKPLPKDQPWASRGSVIKLEVSRPIMSTVPDLSRLPVDSARTVLAKSGFKIGALFPESLKSRGVISRQIPKAGDSAHPGSSITLFLTAINKPPVVSPPKPPVHLTPDADLASQLPWIGGVLIILGAGLLFLHRTRAGKIKSSVETHVTVYTSIDYGIQQLNVESFLPENGAVQSDISIRLMPDKGIQETQTEGPLVKSE